MKRISILVSIVAIGVITLAFQYRPPATVVLFLWRYEISVAVVLFVALCLGALVAWLVSIPGAIEGQRTGARLRSQIASLEGRGLFLESRVREMESGVA